MKRDFDEWLAGFRETIADYKYYVDFGKVYNNVESIRIELRICLNFGDYIRQYPKSF